MNHVLEV